MTIIVNDICVIQIRNSCNRYGLRRSFVRWIKLMSAFKRAVNHCISYHVIMHSKVLSMVILIRRCLQHNASRYSVFSSSTRQYHIMQAASLWVFLISGCRPRIQRYKNTGTRCRVAGARRTEVGSPELRSDSSLIHSICKMVFRKIRATKDSVISKNWLLPAKRSTKTEIQGGSKKVSC